MQKTIYACDNCLKDIGNVTHVSLVLDRFRDGCGVYTPPKKHEAWKKKEFPQNFVHFCTPQCIKEYFAKLIKETHGK